MSALGSEWLGMPNQEHWQEDAVCRQVDNGDTWFPEKSESVTAAKKVCWHACPVRIECLSFAFTHDERWGVWGGWSETERRRARRGQDVNPRIPKSFDLEEKRCQWCGFRFRGDKKYCGRWCSNSAWRARSRNGDAA